MIDRDGEGIGATWESGNQHRPSMTAASDCADEPMCARFVAWILISAKETHTLTHTPPDASTAHVSLQARALWRQQT